MSRLEQARAEAAQGAGRCVLISGEAGIGKTRMVAELQASFAGCTLKAQSYAEDASFPFAPLQAALRELRDRAGLALDALIERRAADLVAILPELADYRTAAPAMPDTHPNTNPAARQRALFEALAGLLFDLAARQPLLVVFEDLHWSDESTLAFLRFLARRLANHPILLIGAYRPGEGSAPLAELLATLMRERLAEEIALGPLTRHEVDALLRGMFDSARSISADFLDTVTTFSEGNPLYVEELVGAMVQAGDIYQLNGVWTRKTMAEARVPPTVQESVRRRSDALDAPVRQVLALAAVAGRVFDFEVLAEVTGLAESALLAMLKQLIEARFILEGPADAFTFRHALLREAVQGQLLARERKALHRRIAAALERRHGTDTNAHAAELAYHYYEAGAWEQALPYARRAAAQARDLDATSQALIQFTRGLDCAQRLGKPPPLDLLLGRADLHAQAGQFAAAEADLMATLENAGQPDQPYVRWQALLKLGQLWATRDYDRSLAWLEQALAAATLGDPLTQAETLNRIGNVYLNQNEPEQALRRHQAALAVFETIGDRTGQANTLELMAVSYYNLPDVLAGAACDERALALAQAIGDRSIFIHAAIHRLLPLSFTTEVGPRVDALRLIASAEEALALARVMGWPGGEAQVLGLLGEFHGLLGQYDRALSYVQGSLQLAAQVDHAAGMAASERLIAWVLLDLLSFDEAADRLRRARSLAAASGAQLFGEVATFALAQTLTARHAPGDLAEAHALLTDLLIARRRPGDLALRTVREARCGQAELELAQGNAVAALAILNDLLADTRHLATHGLSAVPRLALLLGQALFATGRTSEAEAALAEAQSGAQAQGRRPLLWRIHVTCGRLRLALRQRRAAQEAFNHARAVISELATDIPTTALRENFVRRALATMPALPTPTPRRTDTEAHHGLTARERTVAALAARGLSNRAIADALVISERTAERHVANIFAKLGLSSRVQLAAWVAAHPITE